MLYGIGYLLYTYAHVGCAVGYSMYVEALDGGRLYFCFCQGCSGGFILCEPLPTFCGKMRWKYICRKRNFTHHKRLTTFINLFLTTISLVKKKWSWNNKFHQLGFGSNVSSSAELWLTFTAWTQSFKLIISEKAPLVQPTKTHKKQEDVNEVRGHATDNTQQSLMTSIQVQFGQVWMRWNWNAWTCAGPNGKPDSTWVKDKRNSELR